MAARFGVERLFLFGSAARDEMGEGSDVDVLVEFEWPSTFRGYFDLKDRVGFRRVGDVETGGAQGFDDLPIDPLVRVQIQAAVGSSG